jgi:hypothetical protein
MRRYLGVRMWSMLSLAFGSSRAELLSDPQINQPNPVGPFDSPEDSRLSDQSCRRASAS